MNLGCNYKGNAVYEEKRSKWTIWKRSFVQKVDAGIYGTLLKTQINILCLFIIINIFLSDNNKPFFLERENLLG